MIKSRELLRQIGYELKVGIITAQGNYPQGIPNPNFYAAVDFFTRCGFDVGKDVSSKSYFAWSFIKSETGDESFVNNFKLVQWAQRGTRLVRRDDQTLPVFVVGHNYCKAEALNWFNRIHCCRGNAIVHLVDDINKWIRRARTRGFLASHIAPGVSVKNLLDAMITGIETTISHPLLSQLCQEYRKEAGTNENRKKRSDKEVLGDIILEVAQPETWMNAVIVHGQLLSHRAIYNSCVLYLLIVIGSYSALCKALTC